MANPKKRVPENLPGDFFVDSTCIDCDACRQIAPAVFGEAAETSFVKAQQVASAARRQADLPAPTRPRSSQPCPPRRRPGGSRAHRPGGVRPASSFTSLPAVT